MSSILINAGYVYGAVALLTIALIGLLDRRENRSQIWIQAAVVGVIWPALVVLAVYFRVFE